MTIDRAPTFFRTALPILWILFAFSLPTAAQSRPNLLLISIDTLRADRLGCYGYKRIQTPQIDQLAAEGVRFESAVAAVPLTLPSHSTIMTGTYPPYHGVRDNIGFILSKSRTTLAEILQKQGYQTAAFLGSYVLNAKFGLSQGFDDYDDRIAGSSTSTSGSVVNLNTVERSAAEVISRAIGWVDSRSRSPFFLWVHLFDPHDPYTPPGPFKEQYKERPYDGEIAYVDLELGKLLETLRTRRLYENTVIVLLGDHGESFGEHQEWTHGYFIYDTTLLVPLIIKPVDKGLAGRTVIEQVSLVDVVPTVLKLLNVQSLAVMQGREMVSLMKGQSHEWPGIAYCETHYPSQFGWSPLVGIRRRDAKLIQAPKPELFQLSQDPSEQTNRILTQRVLADEMRTTLAKLESTVRNRSAEQTARVELSPHGLDALRSLGYLGASSAPAGEKITPEAMEDPKDKIRVYRMISSGSQDVAAGRYLQAIPLLEKVIESEPGMRIAWSMLGRCHFQLNRFEAARKAFLEILKHQPKNLDAQFYVAACDYRQKNWPAAEKGFKKLLDQDGSFPSAHLYLGFLYQARGNNDLAQAAFQRVLMLEPENEDAHAKVGYLLASAGKVAEAIPHFQKVIQWNPNDAEAHSNLGNAYGKLGRSDLAQKEFEEACRLERKYCRN